MAVETLDYKAFAARYCERMENTPMVLRATLSEQREAYKPDGWMLLECVDMSSRYLGHYVILPYGPNNTFKEPPTRPISPRGLASDMSSVVAILRAGDL